MKTSSLLLAGAVLVAAAGCNFAPRYRRPEMPSSTAFKEAAPGAAPNQGWRPAEPQDAALRGDWWKLYGDPALDALEERVAVSNQTVIAAEAAYRSARALAGEAEGAFFPTVTVDPSVIRSRSSPAAQNSNSPPSATEPRTLYTLPLEASYEVDLWGKVRNQAAENVDEAQASAADVATALLSTRVQVAQDYFQLRALDEERQILDTTLADYRDSLHLVGTLYRNGLASDEDMAEAETQLDAAEAQATDLGVARAQTEHALAVLVGLPPSDFGLPVASFAPSLPAVPVGLPSDLLERRPDIAAAERRVAAANAGIGLARAAYFPDITLGATAGYESQGLSKLFDWPNRIWSVGPSAVQTLFAGGAIRAANAQARAAFDQAAADYRQTVLTAFQGVEDNLAGLRILGKEVAQQGRATSAARREVVLSLSRYKLGLDSYVNVITAQNTFLTNREAEIQAQLRQVVASIDLIGDLGGGWDTSQLRSTAKTAAHPPAPAAPPAEASPAAPNPPHLPPTQPDQDLLKS